MLNATYRHCFSDCGDFEALPNDNKEKECYLKFFPLDGLRPPYEELRVTNKSWISRGKHKAFPDIKVQSLAVMGPCNWEISW